MQYILLNGQKFTGKDLLQNIMALIRTIAALMKSIVALIKAIVALIKAVVALIKAVVEKGFDQLQSQPWIKLYIASSFSNKIQR